MGGGGRPALSGDHTASYRADRVRAPASEIGDGSVTDARCPGVGAAHSAEDGSTCGGAMQQVLARGTALFFGAFSLAAWSVGYGGGGTVDDLWWIDARFLPDAVVAPASLVAALLLIWWALAPAGASWRVHGAATLTAMLAAIAVRNAGDYYALRESGSFVSAAPVPLSAVIAGLLAWVAIAIARSQSAPPLAHDRVVRVACVALALAVVFPLAQVYFFGTTDYRRPADAVVVLGARVCDDGRLSTSLEDRVRTAVELYEQGLVPTLVMSGGIGANGIDEADAMRRRAIDLGVPPDAILCDHTGMDTDATVRNTQAMFRAKGIDRVLAVSQFYHLPRIKLAYRAAGIDVCTVPAMERIPISSTNRSIAREVPGFWVYWVRAWMRGLEGSEGVDLAVAPAYSSTHE